MVVGAALVVNQAPYPARVEPYEVQQTRNSYSDFLVQLNRVHVANNFSFEMNQIYVAFAESQERLGLEFEAAIFCDIESLYEV